MVIVGLGGLTKDILSDLLQQYSPAELLFFTEVENDTNLSFFENAGLKATSDAAKIKEHFEADKRFLILIGNNVMREKLVNKYRELGGEPHYFISKSANLNLQLCKISTVNTVIMHAAMVSAGAVVSEGAIINQYAYLGHDAEMGRYAFLGGYSGMSKGILGDYTFVGVASVILPGRTVGKHSLIGAMTMVNKNIGDKKKAYGTPVKEYPID